MVKSEFRDFIYNHNNSLHIFSSEQPSRQSGLLTAPFVYDCSRLPAGHDHVFSLSKTLSHLCSCLVSFSLAWDLRESTGSPLAADCVTARYGNLAASTGYRFSNLWALIWSLQDTSEGLWARKSVVLAAVANQLITEKMWLHNEGATYCVQWSEHERNAGT